MSHAFDTNIAIYALVSKEPEKRDAAISVMYQATISTQIFSEFTSVALRKYGMPMEIIEPLLADLERHCTIHPITLETLAEARRLTALHKLSYYDAQIIASARLAGCTTLYTEDGHDGHIVEGIALVNPFGI